MHHRFDVAALLPVGDFIAHAAAWSGLGPARLCVLLSGASDVSSGASAELDRLRAALRADAKGRALIDAAQPPREIVARLRSVDGELGAAARGWMDLVSYRLQNGLDISELTNGETPELLLTTIRGALNGTTGPHRNVDADVATVRERVPPTHHNQFDELLANARLMYRLRDERGLYGDIWAAGIMRLGVLEAGRRLVAAGRLERAELLLDAGWDEIRALLMDGNGPTNAALADRSAPRARNRGERRDRRRHCARRPRCEWVREAAPGRHPRDALDHGGIQRRPPALEWHRHGSRRNVVALGDSR